MRLALALFVLAGVLRAQPARPAPANPTGQPTKDDLTLMVDEMRAAIRRDDWSEASRLAVRINAALLMRNRTQTTPSLELQHLETLAGRDSITRGPFLARLAKAAFAASDYNRADTYATEALEAARHGVFWWTGDAIHQGNIVRRRGIVTNRRPACAWILPYFVLRMIADVDKIG